jgi:hypothetical protein
MPNIFGAGGGGTTNIFSSSGGGSALSLLSAARSFYKGIGLSANARAITDGYLDQSVSGLNTILSLNVSGNASIEAVQQKIKAIRASLPRSAISPDVLAADDADAAKAANADNGAAAAGKNGTNVDTSA